MQKLSRKSFFFVLNAGIVAFFIFLWERLTKNEINQTNLKNNIFPFIKSKKVNFSGDYIVINSGENPTVLLARCTHLGCKIRDFQNGKLICPCHGSEYDLTGTPVKGPAYKSLEKIEAKVSADSKTIEIIG